MRRIEVIIDGERLVVEFNSAVGMRTELTVDGNPVVVTHPNYSAPMERWHWFDVDGRSFEIDIDPELRWIRSVDGLHRIEICNLDRTVHHIATQDGRVKAPIPGLVTRVFVEQGQTVETGQRLLILEAMKMENEISAPKDGRVFGLNAFEGKSVALGEVLLTVESP